MDRIARRALAFAGIALGAIGCSSGSSSSNSQPVVAPNGTDCIQSGGAACDSTLSVMCGRFAQCCAMLTAGSCQPWATDMALCKAHWLETGFNCSAPNFASRAVCPTTTSDCQDDIPLVACTDVANGTANWPATCTMFWSQFR